MLRQDAREIEKVPLSNSINQCTDDKSHDMEEVLESIYTTSALLDIIKLLSKMVVSIDTQPAVYEISCFSLASWWTTGIVWVTKFLTIRRVWNGIILCLKY